MKAKSLKLNATLNVAKTVASLLFPLITFPYVSRILLPEGTGEVNYANSIISYFQIIASLGIGTYAIREAAVFRDDKNKLSKFAKEIITLNLISTIVAYICFFLALTFFSKLYEHKKILCICSASILLSTLGIDWLYSALEEYTYITIRSLSFQIISVLLLFIFVKTKEDYIKYAAIGIFSSAGSNILNLIHSRNYINFFIKARLNLKQHVKPIFILFITSVAINIFTILDTSMLGLLTNTTEVGYYSAASRIIRMLRDLFPAVFTVLFARLSYYASKSDDANLITLSKKTLSFIFLMALPMTTGVFILLPSIIYILCGEAFSPAINTARTMAPLLILSSYSGFLGGQLMIATQKEKTYMYCMISAALIDSILNFILIPKFGALGAALATLITEMLIFIVYTILFHSFLKQLNLKQHITQCLASTFIMTTITFSETIFLKSTISKIIVIPITGILIYIICLYFLKNTFFMDTIKLISSKLSNKQK